MLATTYFRFSFYTTKITKDEPGPLPKPVSRRDTAQLQLMPRRNETFIAPLSWGATWPEFQALQ